ncbi:MAG TPA: phage tail tape measure protein, partial [Haploplasma sp.]|nr:phage tail tape measure protein [Haploplasma sp.]
MPNNNWKIKVSAELNKNAGKEIQDGLNKVTPKPIEVPFKIDFKNSKEIENEMKRIVSNLTNGKGELANFKIDTSTIFDKDLNKRVEKINSAIIKYKNELGEVISEQYKFNKIGSNIDDKGKEEAIMGWSKAMSTYGQNIEQVTKKEEALAKKQQASMMKQKELVEEMKLLQIQTNKSGTTLDQDNLTGFDTANKNNNIKEMTHYLKLAKTEYSQLNAMMEKDLPISGLENMKKNIGTMPIDIQNVETSFKKLQVQPEELRTRIDQLGNSFKSLESFKGAEADKVKQYNLLKGEITGVTKEVKSLIAVQQQQISLDDKTKFSSSITSWSNDNIKGAKLFRVELERIQRELVGADKTKFTSLKKEFQSIQAETKAMGKSGRTAFQEIGNNFKKFASWYGIAGITTSAVRGIKQMVSTVVELDKSLVDLQQATGFTAEETGKLLNTYIDLGQELGATGTEVAQAADVWLRQGKSLAETNTLIRDSMILSKIGQVDSAKATQYLTSAMKGYKLEASEVLSVIDRMASVDLSSATSIGGLAEAMSRTATGASMAGIEMDKLLGMLAVVGEVTQKSMDSIGESFKTIFARMGNVKLGKFVDEDGSDITTEINDVEKILNKVDIKLRDSATSFRNFGDVLDDVGGSWS